MVIQEHFFIRAREYVRSYSDKGVKIYGGFPEGDYDEAQEPADFGRTYTETEIPVDADAEEIVDILMGVEE